MSDLTVTQAEARLDTSFRVRVILAFFAIYILWGTTFLAIRIAVAQLPPLFAAGVRFLIAGVVLFCFMRIKGEAGPTRIQWRNLLVMGVLMFVAEYGPLFWAEKTVPSGVMSVLSATIPLLTLVIEMLVLRQSWRAKTIVATAVGFAGVGLLLMPGSHQSYGLIPCLAVLAGSATWALGSVLSRSMSLPKSRPLTAGAAMMLGGAMLLILSAGFGELHPLPHFTLRAALAMAYLIVVGSLISFTAYVWLLAHMPATRVSSYAYVNPIVAVALGYFVASEPVTARTLGGAALVIVSVFIILRKDKATAQ